MKQLLFFLLLPIFTFGQDSVTIESIEFLGTDLIIITKKYKDSVWRDTTDMSIYYGYEGAYADSIINRYPEGFTCFVPGCKEHGNPEIKGDPSGKFAIKGSDGIKVHEDDNGMIRITRKESDAEFWRRKYAELLKSHLEIIKGHRFESYSRPKFHCLFE